jgi:phage shock protein A
MVRKQVKELPEKIDQLERRIANLTQDMATAKTHEHDRIVIDGRPRQKEDVQEALAEIL